MRFSNELKKIIGNCVSEQMNVLWKDVKTHQRSKYITLSESTPNQKVLCIFEDLKGKLIKHKPRKWIFCHKCHEKSYWVKTIEKYVCNGCVIEYDVEQKVIKKKIIEFNKNN